MKYEQFRQLSSEKKEEWHFKFDHKKRTYTFSNLFIYVFLLYMSLMASMSLLLLAYERPEMGLFKAGVLMFDLVSRVSGAIVVIVLFDVVCNLAILIYTGIKEKKWLKRALEE